MYLTIKLHKVSHRRRRLIFVISQLMLKNNRYWYFARSALMVVNCERRYQTNFSHEFVSWMLENQKVDCNFYVSCLQRWVQFQLNGYISRQNSDLRHREAQAFCEKPSYLQQAVV